VIDNPGDQKSYQGGTLMNYMGIDHHKQLQDKEKGNRIKIEFLRDKKKRNVEVEIEEEERSSIIRFDNRDGWEDYAGYWDDYGTSLRKQYKVWGDRYFQDFQSWMKKLKKYLEESTRKSTEATQRLLRSLKAYKVVKV